MRIVSILGTHFDLTEAIKAAVTEKLSSLEKLCERFEPCEIVVEVGKTGEHHNKGKIFRAEFTMSMSGGTLRAEALEEDLYEAIDAAKDQLKRQIVDHKEKMDR